MKIMNSTREETYYIQCCVPRCRIEHDPKANKHKLNTPRSVKTKGVNRLYLSSAWSPLNCLQVLVGKEGLLSPPLWQSDPSSSALPENVMVTSTLSLWAVLCCSRLLPGETSLLFKTYSRCRFNTVFNLKHVIPKCKDQNYNQLILCASY